MDIRKLRSFLSSLTVKELKDICANHRNWGVYSSRTAITGYSKCKNKKELVSHIFSYFAKHNDPRGFYYEDKGSQWSFKKEFHDFQYNGEKIISTPLFSIIYQELETKNLKKVIK